MHCFGFYQQFIHFGLEIGGVMMSGLLTTDSMYLFFPMMEKSQAQDFEKSEGFMLRLGQGQVSTELFRILQVNERRPWQSIHTFRGSMTSSEGECHHQREGRPPGREVVQTKLTPILSALVCSEKQGPAFPGFPGGSDGKESTCNAGDLGSMPGSGRSPGGGKGNPLQYS